MECGEIWEKVSKAEGGCLQVLCEASSSVCAWEKLSLGW